MIPKSSHFLLCIPILTVVITKHCTQIPERLTPPLTSTHVSVKSDEDFQVTPSTDPDLGHGGYSSAFKVLTPIFTSNCLLSWLLLV